MNTECHTRNIIDGVPAPQGDGGKTSVSGEQEHQVECDQNCNVNEESSGEFDEDGYPKIVQAKSGLFEWGFDKTSFSDDEQDGVASFRELLPMFGLEEAPLETGSFFSVKFVWIAHKENKYLKLVTSTNPITGQHGDIFSDLTLHGSIPHSKGMLDYVGVECDSAELLREFIVEFRKRATHIKEECNGRVYI